MSVFSTQPKVPVSDQSSDERINMSSKARLFTWTGLFFAVLQSVCSFFVLLGGLRLLFGAASLVAVAQVGHVWDRLHADVIRVPMMAIALIAVVLSLISTLRVRRLRKRPASQWRQQPISPKQRGLEHLQIWLQALTILLLISEEAMHLHSFHHL